MTRLKIDNKINIRLVASDQAILPCEEEEEEGEDPISKLSLNTGLLSLNSGTQRIQNSTTNTTV